MKQNLSEEITKITQLMSYIDKNYPKYIDVPNDLLSEMALKLQHDKDAGILVVVSDLKDKRSAANPEIVKDEDEELVNELFMEMVYEYRKY